MDTAVTDKPPPLVYLDSSVLITFLFEEREQPEKFRATQRLAHEIEHGSIQAVVSFYALPEIYAFVQEYHADQVSAMFRLSILQLFSLPLQVFPFLGRDQLDTLRQSFKISDPDDVRHVVVALATFCNAIITFDHHFQQVRDLIPVFSPNEFLVTLSQESDDK